MLRLLSYLPFPVLYAFSEFLAFFTYHVIGYRRGIVSKNLKASFPEKSDAERESIAKTFYRDLCDYAVETLKLLTMSDEEVKRRMVCVTKEVEQSLSEEKGAMVYLTAHNFNWEWMVAAVCLNGKPKLHYVYQPQSSRFFDDFSNFIRQRFGAAGIRRDQVGREAVRLRGTQYALAILADQFPGLDHDKRHWTEFLHQDTAFFAATFQLSMRIEAPIFFFTCKKLRRGYYQYGIIPIARPPYLSGEKPLVEAYAEAVEHLIYEQPENWLWSHNRWKRSRKEMGDA